MMKPENLFTITKNYFEKALNNYELLQSHNEETMKLLLENMEQENKKLDRNYCEWIENTNKAFEDYREIIFKGLDYLSDCLENNIEARKETTR